MGKNTLRMAVIVIPILGVVLSVAISLGVYQSSTQSTANLNSSFSAVQKLRKVDALRVLLKEVVSGVSLAVASQNSNTYKQLPQWVGALESSIEPLLGSEVLENESLMTELGKLKISIKTLSYKSPEPEDQKFLIDIIRISRTLDEELKSLQGASQAGFEKTTAGFMKANSTTFYIFQFSSLFLSVVLMFTAWLSRKQVESILQIERSEELHRMLFSSLAEGVLLVDTKGQILANNRSAIRILESPEKNLQGLNLNLVFPTLIDEEGERYEEHNSPLLKMVRSPLPTRNKLVGIFYSGSERKWLSLSCTPFHLTSARKTESTLVSFVDVTEKVEQEKIIEMQRQEIVAKSKLSALGEMAGGIAHEINNPLAVIQSKAEDLEEMAEDNELNSEETRALSQKIQNTVDRISKIVTGLRVFSRDGSNDDFQWVNSHTLIDETLELCRAKVEHAGVELRSTLPGSETLLWCRQVQISQVLLNLITNSLHAVEDLPEKWIHVEVTPMDNEQVAVSVTDSGSGIPKEVQEKIFQPFFTTKEIGKGTGLGLSISQGIINAHGSELNVDNASRKTKIFFQLKAAVSKPEVPAA